MIKSVMKCEQCGKEQEISIAPVLRIKDNWFSVYKGDQRNQEPCHFCSEECLHSSDWDKLTRQQKDALHWLRERIWKHAIAEIEMFYLEHPELQISASLTTEGLIRGNHDTLREEKP